jgi:hypothetical protein
VENSKKILELQAQTIEEATKARQVETENQLNFYTEHFNRSIGKLEEETKKIIGDFERSFKESISENTPTNALSSNLEKTEGKVEILSLKFSEIKALMEVERMQWKLKEAEHINEKQAMEYELKLTKQEIAEWKNKVKLESERFTNENLALKQELEEKINGIVDKRIEAFKNEHKP